MQDRHQGRRTTRVRLAMTQNPAALLHLQHACMLLAPRGPGCLPGPARVCPAGPAVVPLRRVKTEHLQDLDAATGVPACPASG
jgi:hypothetical protein